MLKTTQKQIELLTTIAKSTIELNDNINEFDGRTASKLITLNKKTEELTNVVSGKAAKSDEIASNTLGQLEKLSEVVERIAIFLDGMKDKVTNSYLLNHKLEAHQINNMRTVQVLLSYNKTKEIATFTVLSNKIKVESYDYSIEALMKKYPDNNQALGLIRVLLKKTVWDENLERNIVVKAITLFLKVSVQEVVITPQTAYEIFKQSIISVAEEYLAHKNRLDKKAEVEKEPEKAETEGNTENANNPEDIE